MPTYKSFNEITSLMIEQLKLIQPNLDTKPGTVSRDLFIDLPADQLEKLYKLISLISEKQSPDTAVGSDLDKYAANYGVSRRNGSYSIGIVIFTVNSIATDIPIPAGSIVTSKSGVNFKIVGNHFFSSSEKGRHAATASRIRKSLQLAGISDKYAIEVPVQAVRAGTSGNVGSLQIVTHNLDFDMKIVNLLATNGGVNQENDFQFRTRVSSIFSGANTGTALGYKNAVLSISGILDALVVQPGNSLMLRDGTEVIEVNDGSKRILSSGTGGKVDIYVLGKQLVEVNDSFIFTDSSGSGKIEDERNDFILGQGGIDPTLTSDEKRYLSLKTGTFPLQPVSSITSVVGSSSGILSPKSVSSSGKVSGNYELIKDNNVDTGGSPFSMDKIHFISGEKEVTNESIIKDSFNSISALNYTDVKNVADVFYDFNIIAENSSVLLSDRSAIKTLHSPITSVTVIQNKTTGEYYGIEPLELDPDTGLNNDGMFKITGKNLPSQSDVLSVSYTWRKFYDKYIDFNGYGNQYTIPSNVVDSIDWGNSNFIRDEESIIEKSNDNNSYIINLGHEISRVISASLQKKETLIVQKILVGGVEVLGVIVSGSSLVEGVSRISSLLGVELYNTNMFDGYYSGTSIVLPSDTTASAGDSVIVYYNKIEIYNLNNTDASFYDRTITLPSDSILEENNIDGIIFDYYNSSSIVYVSYVGNFQELITSYPLSSAPISGDIQNDYFVDNQSLTINSSVQPILFKKNSLNENIDYIKYAPSNLALDLSGSLKPGKIKISGTSLSRVNFTVTYGIDAAGLKFDLSSYIKSFFGKSTLDSSYYIARVDEVYTLDSGNRKLKSFDVVGSKIKNNIYDLRSAYSDSSVLNTQFLLPSTSNNLSIQRTAGTKIVISVLIAKENDFEDVYFSTNSQVYSSKSYGFISKINVTSGFRNAAGNIVGNLAVYSGCQPPVGRSFLSNYSFIAPKEGERISIKYNINRLLLDATTAVERVRPITSDVIIKEAAEILVDISGEVLVNEDQIQNADFILQNVSDEISKLLSTNALGPTIDYSDVISAGTRVSGVDSINISQFNVSGNPGRKSFIKALENQTINPGNIFLEAVSRKDFRIS